MGFVGDHLGYQILARLGRPRDLVSPDPEPSSARCPKVETHFGPGIWNAVRGKRVVDFGCGTGEEAIELARRGAAEVIGLDIQERWLLEAKRSAAANGVAANCSFARETNKKADLVLSIDSFEHFEDPADVLETMSDLLAPNGQVWISFGWPWYHPYGGHLFSVFPWAHLIFSEAALIRWRSEFKTDGATRFREVEGGLNQMSIKRFERTVQNSSLEWIDRTLVPIKPLRWFHRPSTREFTTALVQSRLKAREPDLGTA